MEKLTKEQLKIIYIGAVTLASLFLFWIFIYAPQSRRFNNIKIKIKQAETEVAQIKGLVQDKPLAEAVKDMSLRLNKLSAGLPGSQEEVIRNLSEAAKKFKIEIKDIAFSPKQALAGKITGYAVKELPITLRLSGDYRAIGEYLTALRESHINLIKARQLEIKASGEANPVLDINLQVSAYLTE